MTAPAEGDPRTPKRIFYDMKPRRLEVLRVERLTPRMVRATLGGPEIDGFTCAAPADHVKLVFPDDPDGRPELPAGSSSRSLTTRDYTVRHHRPAAGEIDIDFVVHGSGTASAWAAQARPGQLLGVLGPRGSKVVPFVFDRYLIAGDETALPAVARWLEQLPGGARADVFIEVADPAEEQPLTTAADADITWLHRGGADPGGIGPLAQAVCDLGPSGGDRYAWVAGEAEAVRPVRRHLRRELGMPREWVNVDGYWRRGVSALGPQANEDDDEDTR
ncbi:siderophore-interacting protein [Streptomonospora sediminis]